MRAVDVRPGERRALWLAFAYFFALLASYYLLRPVRDEMGARGRALHWDFSATFVALLVAVPVYSALFARVPRTRAVAGVWGGRVVFSVPGSSAAVRLAWEKLIAPEAGHVLRELRKDATGA